MATEGEKPVSERKLRQLRREAREKTIVRMLASDTQYDTSSKAIVRRIREVRPELGDIPPGLVTRIRRTSRDLINRMRRT